MKIRCEDILPALKRSKALAMSNKKYKIPALTVVHFIDNKIINVDGKDLLIQEIEVISNDSNINCFSFCPIKLYDILSLYEGHLEIDVSLVEYDQSNFVLFEIGNGSFRLSNSFFDDQLKDLNLDIEDNIGSLELDNDYFFENLTNAKNFIDPKDARAYLRGLHIIPNDKHVSFFTSNGTAIYKFFKNEVISEHCKCMLSVDFITKILKFKNEFKGVKPSFKNFTIYFKDDAVIFKNSELMYYHILHEVNNPRFQKVIRTILDNAKVEIEVDDITQFTKLLKASEKNTSDVKGFQNFVSIIDENGKAFIQDSEVNKQEIEGGVVLAINQNFKVDISHKAMTLAVKAFKKKCRLTMTPSQCVLYDSDKAIYISGLK